MVFVFYGKNVSESELEEACETSWLGNICSELVQGATNYGFEAEEIENIAVDYVSASLKKKVPLITLVDPAVLYGGLEGFGHFVVITGIKDNMIYYNDPNMGEGLKAHIDKFFSAWERFSFKGVSIWKSMKK
jgi:predicted double-glycine peptidase